MWRATIKSLLAHKLRLGLTALAVVLGVAFVSGTYILTDTMGKAFDNLFQDINKGVAVAVSGVPKFKSNGPGGETAGSAERVPASLLDAIRKVDGVRVAEGQLAGYAQLVGKDGKAISTGGAPTIGVSVIQDPDLSSATVREGRLPQASGEIVVDALTASKHDLHVGDTVNVLLQGPSMQATIVGLIGFGSSDNLGGATLVGFDAETAQTALDGGGKYDEIDVAAEPGVSPTDLRDRIQAVLPEGVQAKTGAQSAADQSDDIKKSLGFFNIALLVFAAISLFVGAFIIFNTFQILVSQRTRELALLRALGASARQVRLSVLAEALIVGVLSSLVGLVAGFGIAIGLQGLLKLFGIVLPSTGTQLLPRTVIAALVVGIGTTVISSIMPAIRASKLPPVAALREAEPAAYRLTRKRVFAGLGITALGAALLMLGLFGNANNALSIVGLGALVTFLGVAVMGPMLARPVGRFLGAPLPRLRGVPGKLGRENAIRNPKRTASTAAALMIGLGLVSFVSVFAASIKSSSNRILEEAIRADYIVTSPQFTGFSQDIAARLRTEPVFSAVEEFRQGLFGLNGNATQIQGTDPANLSDVINVKMVAGSLSALGDDDVLVYKSTADSHGWKVGDTVEMEFARTGTQKLTLVGIHSDNRILGNFVVSLPTYEKNFTLQLDNVVAAKTAAGVSPAEAKAAVAAVAKEFPNVKLEDQDEFRKSQANQIDKLLGLIDALLLLSILIALVGIINTLALSILERTREIGLLRAVGMARKQIRSMVRWEAVIIAVFGALLGSVVGVFFGWAIVQALHSQGITVLTVPGGQLITYVVIAGLFGVIAAVLPARRAAKLDVLKAVVTE
jgi:putative ABC transport system permease protein